YSRKTFTFIGFGGTDTNPATGSPFAVLNQSGSTILGYSNAPYFCGICGNETRNNNSWNAKSTYFWSTKGLGTHNLIGGVERWAESRFSNNYQSPTNFVLRSYATANTLQRNPDGTPLVGVYGSKILGQNSYIIYFPILTP